MGRRVWGILFAFMAAAALVACTGILGDFSAGGGAADGASDTTTDTETDANDAAEEDVIAVDVHMDSPLDVGRDSPIDMGVDSPVDSSHESGTDAPVDSPPDTPSSFILTVVTNGNGTGTVTGGAITCPGTCTATVTAGTMVNLMATAGSGSVFVGWSGGGCSGTGACAVTVTASTTVTASFALDDSLVVTETGAGTGTVTSSPAGINCGSTCTASYAPGTMVTLTETAGPNSVFTGWSGACTGTGSCVVTVSMAVGVTANFDLQTFPLTVSTNGSGTGSVTSSPSGINCGTTCSASYAYGTMVTLTPAAGTGSTFTGWGGACSGTGACTVDVTAAESVTASFTINSYTLSVTLAGGGSGSVASNPAGIGCGTVCSATYTYDTTVNLTATPTGTSTFRGWSGACSGTGTCSVTMTAASSVTATFAAPPNYVFVTSTTSTGNMGGLSGADAICQARATAANLPGTYRAWLSTTTVNANTRLGNATGWIRVDGKPFAQTQSQVFNGDIYYPLRINELGADVLNESVFTATTVGGVNQNADDCTAWTSASSASLVTDGWAQANGGEWTVGGQVGCNASYPIYCFGISNVGTTTVPAPVGAYRRAFQVGWTPGGGLSAADSACQNAATAAGLSGTYEALLATSTASALSRFSTTGAPWYRVDNVLPVSTAAAWGTATYFDADPNVSADGSTTYGNDLNWSGSASLTTAGTAASTCTNWTNTTQTATSGNANATEMSLYLNQWGNTEQCNFGAGTITCLQL